MPNPSAAEAQISNQIKYLGIVMYLWMEKSDNWGGFSSAAITQYHSYHLLNLPLSTTLTPEHLNKFEEEIAALAEFPV